jgi:hypothetical protein
MFLVLRRVRSWAARAPSQTGRRIIKIDPANDAALRHLLKNDCAKPLPLVSDRVHHAKHVLRTMIDLAHQEVLAFLVLLALRDISDGTDEAHDLSRTPPRPQAEQAPDSPPSKPCRRPAGAGSINITLDVYGHLFPKADATAEMGGRTGAPGDNRMPRCGRIDALLQWRVI